MSDDDWIERHPKPYPHFVMTQATLDKLCDLAKPAHPTTGFASRFGETPVYVDECPWACESGRLV